MKMTWYALRKEDRFTKNVVDIHVVCVTYLELWKISCIITHVWVDSLDVMGTKTSCPNLYKAYITHFPCRHMDFIKCWNISVDTLIRFACPTTIQKIVTAFSTVTCWVFTNNLSCLNFCQREMKQSHFSRNNYLQVPRWQYRIFMIHASPCKMEVHCGIQDQCFSWQRYC